MSRLPTSEIIKAYRELLEKLSQTTQTEDLIKLGREQKKLEIQNELAEKIQALEQSIAQNQELLTSLGTEDQEMIELTQEDQIQKQAELTQAEEKLLSYLSPKDSRDDYDIYLEIRAGAGGDESSLFAAELLRAYSYMCQKLGFKFNLQAANENTLGGYKEVIAEIRGEEAYAWFKYESGVHRVQRVPATEKQGRIHTSTVAVAIMPLIEADNNQFKLDPKEIEMIVSTSSGKGGQSVNTTYSAVKMRHIPTGIEAQSQDERSQVQNRIKCLSVLTSRVFDHYEQKRLEEEAAKRREQVGKMDRSEKIRTYNFPQDRLTDHRYNHNWSQLPGIMNGDILQVVEDIRRLEAERNLQNLGSSNPAK